MKTPRRSVMPLLCAWILSVSAPTPNASAETVNALFPDGANSLFAGHSFFVPVANSFDQIAIENGFTAHEADFVFRGGMAGTPTQLWEDEVARNAVIDRLATGEVELFGLTAFLGEGDVTFSEYQRWFDEALIHNPNTYFLIGQPWVVAGPNRATAEFDRAIEARAEASFEVVQQLREAYPDNHIEFINYGKTASVMKARFDEGELPDILGLLPDPENMIDLEESLFADAPIGHAGPMMLELSGLSWVSTLYGTDVADLRFTDFDSDVDSIVREVLDYNAQFRALSAVPEPSTFFAITLVTGLVSLRRRR